METHESFDSKLELETPDRVVIIGGGPAGAKTAQALRDKGFAGGITIVAAEQHLPYERPLLSKEYLTGRKPFEKARVLTIAGAKAQGVFTLRTKEDADQIRSAFGSDQRLVVIGGGWIGLEVAVAARAHGTAVTVLEHGDLPLLGGLGHETAQVFANLHVKHGVQVRCNVRVVRVEEHDGQVTGVRLATGVVIDADSVVVGIGAAP